MRSSELGEGRLRFSNEYSYPLNTIDKPTTIEYVTAWFCKKNIIGLGRWGRWEHMNSDVAVWEALKLADKLIGKA
jgi:UDP-galactopyranose mutase